MTDDKFLTTERAVLATAVGGFALVLCWFLWWGRYPQIAHNEEAVKIVDALFTAITAKDTKRLGECEQRLHALKDAGKLSSNAAEYLDGLIAKARAGNWRRAAEQLYSFMQAQRRQST